MAMREETTYTPENLFYSLGKFPVVTGTVSIPAGASLKRGSLVTTAGALVKSTTVSGESGSTTTWDEVYGVLAEDITTTTAAAVAVVYLTGEFNASALYVNAANTVAQFEPIARQACIFIKKSI